MADPTIIRISSGVNTPVVIEAPNGDAVTLSVSTEEINVKLICPPPVIQPVNTQTPTVSPNAHIPAGTILTANEGAWFGTGPFTFTYQWQRGRASSPGFGLTDPISGATSRTYTTTGDDVGFVFRVAITATNSVGHQTINSMMTASVTGVPVAPMNQVIPYFVGDFIVGTYVGVANGTWSGFPAPTFTYQLEIQASDSSDWTPVGDPTTNGAFMFGPDDVGKFVHVILTATNDSGTATATSARVGPILAA